MSTRSVCSSEIDFGWDFRLNESPADSSAAGDMSKEITHDFQKDLNLHSLYFKWAADAFGAGRVLEAMQFFQLAKSGHFLAHPKKYILEINRDPSSVSIR